MRGQTYYTASALSPNPCTCVCPQFSLSHQKTCFGFQHARGLHVVPALLQLLLFRVRFGFCSRFRRFDLAEVGWPALNVFTLCLHLEDKAPLSWWSGIFMVQNVSHLLPQSRNNQRQDFRMALGQTSTLCYLIAQPPQAISYARSPLFYIFWLLNVQLLRQNATSFTHPKSIMVKCV